MNDPLHSSIVEHVRDGSPLYNRERIVMRRQLNDPSHKRRIQFVDSDITD